MGYFSNKIAIVLQRLLHLKCAISCKGDNSQHFLILACCEKGPFVWSFRKDNWHKCG